MDNVILNRSKKAFSQLMAWMNSRFNAMPAKRKKLAILSFGICTSAISVMLIIQALHSQEEHKHFKPERISMPYDIFMKEEQGVLENQLVPVGKMKGEIDGEFESFYVAVDNQGQIYINRDIEYTEKAYEKTEDWKQISREKLGEYERELHFIPNRSRGIKR
jgi:hypothetical protein